MVPVDNQFVVKSIHGFTTIDKKCVVNVFDTNSIFFILPSLSTFDGIIGLDLLTQTSATLDFNNKEIKTNSGIEKLQFLRCANVNFTKIEDIQVPQGISKKFKEMMQNLSGVFANPDEALPYNTNIVATIRTTTTAPTYSKL